jgi:hypothetical protein
MSRASLSLAGFQVTLIGRFWVTAEDLVKIEFYKLKDGGLLERVPKLSGPKSAWRLTRKGKQYITKGA